jgi:hypothetical protein
VKALRGKKQRESSSRDMAACGDERVGGMWMMGRVLGTGMCGHVREAVRLSDKKKVSFTITHFSLLPLLCFSALLIFLC